MLNLSTKKKAIMTLLGVVLARMSYPIIKNLYFLYFKPSFWNHLRFTKSVKREIDRKAKLKNSTVIKMDLEQEEEIQEDLQNTVSIRLLKNLEKKISAATKTNDPFLPPFDEGIFIMNISKTHSLIFNKFMVAKSHLLIITKIFEAQTDQLTENDLFDTYNVMKIHNGFAFFNSDMKSGASQKHKHLQIIPYSEFKTRYLDKILEIIADEKKVALEIDSKLGFTSLFFEYFEPYKYCLGKFREYNPFVESPEIYKKYLFSVYVKCRQRLQIENKCVSFNLLFGANWILFVPRKKEKFANTVSLNSLACLGSILTSSTEKFELLQKSKPSDIFNEILMSRDDENEYSMIKD